jgi:hypothetical protein
VLIPVEGSSSAYTGDGRFAHTERMWLMQRSVFERLAAQGKGALMPLFTHVHMNNWHGNPARKPYDVIVRCESNASRGLQRLHNHMVGVAGRWGGSRT